LANDTCCGAQNTIRFLSFDTDVKFHNIHHIPCVKEMNDGEHKWFQTLVNNKRKELCETVEQTST